MERNLEEKKVQGQVQSGIQLKGMSQGLSYWGYEALIKRELSWVLSKRPNKQLKSQMQIFVPTNGLKVLTPGLN